MSGIPGSVEYLEHTADIGIRVISVDEEQLFKDACHALVSLFIEPEHLQNRSRKEVRIESDEIERLLFQWLNEIVYWFDTEGFIPLDLDAVMFVRRAGDRFLIRGSVGGDTFNASIHTCRLYVKAVTFHKLSIVRDIPGITAEYYVDV